MAWARPPGAPQLPSCPMEVLEPRENDYKSVFDLYVMPVGFGLAGFLAPIATNISRRLPVYTGIWRHFTAAATLGALGYWLNELRREIAADKDEIMRQYIALHPEDFPPYKRKLIKDTIDSWDPQR